MYNISGITKLFSLFINIFIPRINIYIKFLLSEKYISTFKINIWH